ncbi:glycerate kinase type-2 family protein [Pseudovibrio exalbescens]|uniref:Hydroxypyruvate reductase n=1 Tax=Pseudovibrio exalbescens TaxID=197461 RepID=A0A1U7JMD5_9HYPH|nr:glycerate kinase [Pseudovibrio exalbescens]OKL45875.1 hydroxypyruvate reductase [Pseudovibrio exalbescens]
MKSPRVFLEGLFEAAIASAQPENCVPPYLPENISGRLVVIGAGKASAAMARAVERSWDGPLEGLVVTRYGYSVPCERIEIAEAAHPVPDEAGMRAAMRMMNYVSALGEEDTVLCLMSGGGSALLPLPAPGISLEDKQKINRALLKCGATISEMNCIRRHLSMIKGGNLAAAASPARIINLLISDVPGDDPSNIASGPTIFDSSAPSDAIAIVNHYGIELPASAKLHLERAQTRHSPEYALKSVAKQPETHIIAAPLLGLRAAAERSISQGIPAYILSDSIEGEASDVGTVMAGIARHVANHMHPFKTPCLLLSGGETTVTLNGHGRGGRNVEFLLSLALNLNKQPGIYALAGDTDGIDGIEEIAGAYCDPATLKRAEDMMISPHEALANNDAHGFFESIGDSVITGPTLTNINDFRAILVTDETFPALDDADKD